MQFKSENDEKKKADEKEMLLRFHLKARKLQLQNVMMHIL